VADTRDVLLPDIGEFENVDVVEVLVAAGDSVAEEDSLLVLESDKATMEIPSPFAGTVVEVLVAVGDQVSEGALLARIETKATTPEAPAPTSAPSPAVTPPKTESAPPLQARATPEAAPQAPAPAAPEDLLRQGTPVEAHASPSVRRLARELGVELALVPGTGRKGRIVKQDVQGYVKSLVSKGTAAGVPIAGVAVAAPQKFDFSKWGETTSEPLNRIRKLSAANLHRSWVTVPHVTQFDEADITELDAFRKRMKPEAEARDIKLTFLPFVLKACAALLREQPRFNSSLDHTGENLIVKEYITVGVAVETENGLVVPVVRDADKKGLYAIASDLMEISENARTRKLRPADLQGGTFSISSLGGIGGTFFTPIVNHPEVAILGVGKMEWRPIHQDGAFVPRLMLPLSLSYDHRVVDGADAARFTTRLGELLSDLRRIIL
jgi:pyruvate dehydrogenase E2 component (dihydrolipoamide acetyltransferase)